MPMNLYFKLENILSKFDFNLSLFFYLKFFLFKKINLIKFIILKKLKFECKKNYNLKKIEFTKCNFL